jgi:hypothetical protein
MNIKKILAILVLVPAVAFAWQPTKPITVIDNMTFAVYQNLMKTPCQNKTTPM